MVRWAKGTADAGHFAGHAIGSVSGVNPIEPLIDVAQMIQVHKGFTTVLNNLSAIQASLGVLQATTAVIGVGVVAGVAL